MPPPIVAAPRIPITIANAEPAGASVAFAIDGVAHQAPAGSRRDLAVAPNSKITYDGGGSVGHRRYRISPGRYEFRSTAEGWRDTNLPARRESVTRPGARMAAPPSVHQIETGGNRRNQSMRTEASATGGATEVPSMLDYSGTVAAGDSSADTLSRKVADGTKNRLPVTGRLKSSSRS